MALASPFESLLRAADRLQAPLPTATADLQAELSSHVPTQFTLRDLTTGLAQPSFLGQRKHLLALLACFRSKGRIQPRPDDEDSIAELCDFAARSIAPVSRETDSQDSGEEVDYDAVAKRSRDIGLYSLEILQLASSEWSANLSEQALLTIIAFSRRADGPWSTPGSAEIAKELLDEQLSRLNVHDFITEAVLKGYLRPLFSRSRPATVTASGRKAEFADEVDPHRGLSQETKEVKPWKYLDLRTIPVFDWAVFTADETLISKQWPLFVPVILTLLDDSATRIRSRGLVILEVFLGKFPDRVLRDTGLGSVFEDAVFPTLLYLPSLTPESESVQLLEPAYAALLTLAGKLQDGAAKNKLLDKVLRDGIFAGYFHAREHVRIVEVLLRQTSLFVETMGIHAVKHLKDLMPIYSATMTDPFATSHMPSLLSAVRALQTTISTCWPRIARTPWQEEIIRILVLCWLNIQDAKVQGSDDIIKAELTKTANMLSAVATQAGQEDFQEKVAPLVAKEPLLSQLFPPRS
ncbi:hypothetical protein NKR23_g2546 [Pleurostoma richardsiae]|uniref:Uncharacterized protein n=1 Tax=Pleurostoma richardsiae TaxID=41990 RepID=A0AA38SB24_9PEZI|nr:hypothetical protein NKR23_g2546 [Pleurostoma richardsiae]